MTEPLLIVAALNGTRDRKVAKGVPYSAAELAKEAKAAVEAGAGIVHVHARRDDGTPVFDLTYDDVIAAIRSAVDVPVSIATQRQRQTSLGTITALFSVLSELPDLATVNVAPLAPDLPAHREEARQILEALDAAGVAAEPVVPSLEALADLGALYDDGLLAHAPWMHLALGGRPAEAEHGLAGTPQNLLRLVEGARRQRRQAALDRARPGLGDAGRVRDGRRRRRLGARRARGQRADARRLGRALERRARRARGRARRRGRPRAGRAGRGAPAAPPRRGVMDAASRVQMIDVGDKPVTRRSATARAVVRLAPDVVRARARGRAREG